MDPQCLALGSFPVQLLPEPSFSSYFESQAAVSGPVCSLIFIRCVANCGRQPHIQQRGTALNISLEGQAWPKVKIQANGFLVSPSGKKNGMDSRSKSTSKLSGFAERVAAGMAAKQSDNRTVQGGAG